MSPSTQAILARETCSIADAAHVLGVGDQVISRAVHAKKIPFCRPGHHIRIQTSWLREQLGLNLQSQREVLPNSSGG
jgi:excisionase family DNA binding protein